MAYPKVRELVDRGFDLDTKIKSQTSELDNIKASLKAHAELHKMKELEGEKAKALLGAQGSSVCSYDDLKAHLEATGQMDLLPSLIEVKVGKVKELLGESVSAKIVKTERNAFGKITFKPK